MPDTMAPSAPGIMIRQVSENQRDAWNDFTEKEPSFALMQSWEWGEFKKKMGWQAFRVSVTEQSKIVAGAQMLIKPLPLGLASVAYVPRGPIGSWLDPTTFSPLLTALHAIASRHKAIFLRLEPPLLNVPVICQQLRESQFRSSSYTNQPRATILLDLRQDLDDIFKQMRKKTRQYIKGASRKGVTLRMGDHKDLAAFCHLMQITGRRSKFSIRSCDYYKNEWQSFAGTGNAALFMAFYQEELIAVRMVFYHGSHAAEFHAGSSDRHAHLHPNYFLVWEAIKWAKGRGCHTYDLWGIPDQVGLSVFKGEALPATDRADGLWGVYRFKRGFGRSILFYLGAHDYVYSPLLYSLITNKLFNEKRFDQIAARLDSLRPS